jgi:hypothetical protein
VEPSAIGYNRPSTGWRPADGDVSIAPLPPRLGYAGPWRRLTASLIDQTLVALVAAALFGAMAASGAAVVNVSQEYLDYLTSRTAPYPAEGPTIVPAYFAVWCVLVALAAFLYQVVSWSRRGSLGERLLAIQIGRVSDGSRLPVRRAVMRWLVLVLPFAVALVAVPLLPSVDSCDKIPPFTYLVTCTPSAASTLAGPLFLIAISWPLIALFSVALGPRARGFHDRIAGSAMVAPETVGGAAEAVADSSFSAAPSQTAQMPVSRSPHLLPAPPFRRASSRRP